MKNKAAEILNRSFFFLSQYFWQKHEEGFHFIPITSAYPSYKKLEATQDFTTRTIW